MSYLEELDALDPLNGFVGRMETPTPHKVAVLMLVKQYLRAKKYSIDAGTVYPSNARSRFCMLLLKLIQYPDMTYSDLHNLLTTSRYKIELQHLQDFEKAMSDMFSIGIEALFDFAELQNIEKMLAEQLGVSQFSIVGLYIRRVGVKLERLSFPEMMALYKNICLYYEKGVRALAIGPRKTGATLLCSLDPTVKQENVNIFLEESALDTDTVHQDRNPYFKWSAKQADLFVTQQCNLLENNELRALSPIELHTKLNEIVQDNPLNSQAYFLSYMNQLRLRDYFGALHALHRSFDRSPMQMMHQYDQKGFQYFSVNLAVLHANFDHRCEALNALKECVMLAQECGDKKCLDLANSWYCLLNSNHIDPFEKSLPDIQDPGLVQSLSLAIQFVVKFGAQCGYLPLDLFELLIKSDELNGKNLIFEHVTDSLSLRSALWLLYGRNEISALYAQLLLHLKKTWYFGDVGNSESVCKVLSSLALWLYVQGEQQISAVVLQHTRQRFIRCPNAANWMISESLIIIQQAIFRCHWQEAHKACSQLFILDRNAANIQRAATFVARRYFHTARRILYKQLQTKNLDLLTQVRALTLLAYANLPDDSITTAETVELLMRASVLASSGHMEYECAILDMLFAQILLRMNMPQKALRACTNSIDKIYINGSVYDRAKMDFTFIRCLVASGYNKTEQRIRLLRSLNTLEHSVEQFKKLEAHAKVLDVLIYIAKTFHGLGDYEQRNKYACKFRHHYNEFPMAREYLGMAF